MPPESQPGPVRPLLARFAASRHGDPTIPGHFDPEWDVWVVEGPEGVTPIIRVRNDLADTTTHTPVRVEQDDTDVGAVQLAGTTTFKKVNAEGDDTDISCAGLLEVTTKTMAQVEGDDVAYEIDPFSPTVSDQPAGAFRLQ